MIRRRCVAVLLAALLPAAAPAADLLRYVPAAKSARTPEPLVAPTPVTVDAAAVESAGEGGIVDLALPNGKRAAH